MLQFSFVLVTVIIFVIAVISFVRNKTSDLNIKQNALHPTYSVLTVKNHESAIEGVVRSLAWQIQINSSFPQELVVLDLDSEDMTFSILKKLAKEYPFVHPMHKEEYIDFIRNM